MDATAADRVWDAGDLGCGELMIELRGLLLGMPGRVLRVVALDPGATEDIPAWCRITRHALVHHDPDTRSYWIRARGEPALAPDAADGPPEVADGLYTPEIFRLAAALPKPSRLPSPDVVAQAHSKMCGSQIEVELTLAGDRVTGYAQRVKACLLGRASAAVVAREIVGASLDDLHRVSRDMRAMLRDGAEGPAEPWGDLRALAPVRALKGRHPSTLLVFDALDRGMEDRRASLSARSG